MTSNPPPPPPSAPAPAGGFDVGAALSYGWRKFVAHFGQIIVAVFVVVLVLVVLQILGFLLARSVSCDPSPTNDCSGFQVASSLVSLLTTMVSFLVSMIIGAGLVRAALRITEGQRIDSTTVLSTQQLVPVAIASVLISLATAIGIVLCIIPGLIVLFLTNYTLYFIVDKDMGPVEAIRASIDFTVSNLGNLVIWFLVGLVVIAVGFLLCGVGALVAVPVVLIGTAYTYKVLTGQVVVP